MARYLLKPPAYRHLITADSFAPLVELYPDGVTLEIDEWGDIEVRDPVAGDDPENDESD